jgi:esterase/lipase superfamily enzyme
MFVVTNREIVDDATGVARFGRKPNSQGPNELRLAEVTRKARSWSVEFLDDALPKARVRQLIDEFRLPIDPDGDYYASLEVACELTRRARQAKRHILLFVHGYNNDMADVLGAADALERRYGVEVLAFSWPANGGGIHGVLSYKSDKRDARASAGALERTLEKMHEYLVLITQARREELYAKAGTRHPDAAEARESLYAKLLEKDCPFTVNVMFHSMGNYLLKHMLKSSLTGGNGLLFDNVVLCQADTNNREHAEWVDRIRFRNRLFITLNENDFALRASRAKAGSEQLARLGHYARDLASRNAHYVNLTHAAWVRNSHSPFAEPAEKNEQVFDFFRQALSGQAAESGLRYNPAGNWYEPR